MAEYTDNVKWKMAFLKEHPEWQIGFVRREGAPGYHEAVREDPNTMITDYDLGQLMQRVEAATEPAE